MKPHITESDLRSGYAPTDGRGYFLTTRQRVERSIGDFIDGCEVGRTLPGFDALPDEAKLSLSVAYVEAMKAYRVLTGRCGPESSMGKAVTP